MITLNSLVVYKTPNPDETLNGQPIVYVVTELNGDRCFIEPVTSNLHYKPVTVALILDLKEFNK
jgi:hypothetical protein